MTKTEIIDLVKWFLGSFVILFLPIMIGRSLDDRRQGLQEIEKYDKYATQLIIENDNLAKRRLLAQYFANVTPSKTLRDRWEIYYNLLDNQWKALLKRRNKIEEEKKRLREEIADTISPIKSMEMLESSKSVPNIEGREEKIKRLRELEKESAECMKELNGDLKMPKGY